MEISFVDKANPLTIGIPRGMGKIVMLMIQSNEINNVELNMLLSLMKTGRKRSANLCIYKNVEDFQ
jgi:hypothetical protein